MTSLEPLWSELNVGLEDYFDVFLLPGRQLGEKVACPACLSKGSCWQACPVTQFQRATYGTMKNGNYQGGQKQHKHHQSNLPLSPVLAEQWGVLLTTAVRCKSTMGREKELGASWQARSTDSRKDPEAERAREDSCWPTLCLAWGSESHVFGMFLGTEAGSRLPASVLNFPGRVDSAGLQTALSSSVLWPDNAWLVLYVHC